MDAVVTGGCGFIGSHLVEFLLENGFRVKVIDNLYRASVDVFEKFSGMDNVEVEVIDVRDSCRLTKALTGDVVFHLAALTDVEESEIEKSSYWSVNVMGTINVLNAALERSMKVVYASSAAVYGELKNPAVEDMTPNPLNFYGYTKLEAEKECLRYSNSVDVTILRLFNVYGERARAGVVKKFLESASLHRPLTVYGDGENVRDFIYVGDVVEAFYKAYIEKSASGKIINIGSGRPVKIRELAEYIDEKTGVGISYREPRKNDVRYSVADISSAEKILSWKPRTDLFRWISEKLGV
ncbi:MAG: NAD-dependent epimerase/dehydratase family protein [Thaumarchaeota archaeon]|jgi:nucleoside-diphosphate-sugar epimerase|nr:NAD-dependent epimerase/dehydratase family protein [Candidatus Geocrenenecus arthurdayi]